MHNKSQNKRRGKTTRPTNHTATEQDQNVQQFQAASPTDQEFQLCEEAATSFPPQLAATRMMHTEAQAQTTLSNSTATWHKHNCQVHPMFSAPFSSEFPKPASNASATLYTHFDQHHSDDRRTAHKSQPRSKPTSHKPKKRPTLKAHQTFRPFYNLRQANPQ